MSGQQQHDALINNQIDLAFCRRQPEIDGELFHVEQLYVDKLAAVLPLNHPLSQQKDIEIKDLSSERFILFQRELWPDTYDYMLTQCQQAGFSPNMSKPPENMRHLITSISSGLGISIAPSCIHFIAKYNCTCIPIKELNHDLPLYMYYRKQEDNSHLSNFINYCLKSNLQEVINTHVDPLMK
jgi:DNA-binding transcriptional LysR family regulator